MQIRSPLSTWCMNIDSVDKDLPISHICRDWKFGIERRMFNSHDFAHSHFPIESSAKRSLPYFIIDATVRIDEEYPTPYTYTMLYISLPERIALTAGIHIFPFVRLICPRGRGKIWAGLFFLYRVWRNRMLNHFCSEKASSCVLHHHLWGRMSLWWVLCSAKFCFAFQTQWANFFG